MGVLKHVLLVCVSKHDNLGRNNEIFSVKSFSRPDLKKAEAKEI